MSATLHHGNVVEWARAYTGPRFHAVMCDPPYELGFMGRKWDSSGVAFNPDTWAAIASVCKPGAMLLAFGGTRTFHRIAVAIEDAGWEIRDTVMWVYGQGFPKSHDVSKAIDREAGAQREVVGVRTYADGTTGHFSTMHHEYTRPSTTAKAASGSPKLDTAPATAAAAQWSGYGTALKPAYEPVIVARLPLDGTVAHNAQTHGTGALAIDACRVVAEPELARNWDRVQSGKQGIASEGLAAIDLRGYVPSGRFPANLIHDGSDEVLTLFPETGPSPLTTRPKNSNAPQTRNTFGVYSSDGRVINGHGDTGSAARFFYCAKSSTSERGAGLENGNAHPTVKPLALTEYLARLILPPELDEPRRLFVPFAGSGSEVIGARRAGWDVVEGVELEAAHVDIARARVAHWEVAS